MAKPNYSFEKRQRELAKKKKKEEKEKEKADRKAGGASAGEAVRGSAKRPPRPRVDPTGDGPDRRLSRRPRVRRPSMRPYARLGSAPGRPHRAGRLPPATAHR